MDKKKVLIPLDGSALSRQVLPHVQRLLSPEEHTLILLRAAEVPEGVGVPLPPRPTLVVDTIVMPMYEWAAAYERTAHPIYASRVWETAEAELADELSADRRALEAAGYTVAVEIRFGHPVEEIVHVVEQNGVDLVAMATHGWTGLKRLVLGSVAEAVLRRVPVPVLLVRPFRARDRADALDGIRA
jgi:nucleotide-binding universal stress UspA family protein